jgi:hypothetical protein
MKAGVSLATTAVFPKNFSPYSKEVQYLLRVAGPGIIK